MGESIACCNIRQFRIISAPIEAADIKLDGGRRLRGEDYDDDDEDDFLYEDDEFTDYFTLQEYLELFGEAFDEKEYELLSLQQ